MHDDTVAEDARHLPLSALCPTFLHTHLVEDEPYEFPARLSA